MATAQKNLDSRTILETLESNPYGLGVESTVERALDTDTAPDEQIEVASDLIDVLVADGLIRRSDGSHYVTDDGLAALEEGEINPPDPDEIDDDEGEDFDDDLLAELASEVPDHLDEEEVVDYTASNGKSFKFKPGERRVEEDRADEEMVVNEFFPPQGGEDNERTLKRYLTDGEACPLKRRTISMDAIEDGFAEDESEYQDRAIRLVCPECGRATGADINSNGRVRIATHVLPDGGVSAPTVEHFVFEGDEDSPLGQDWVKVDPSDTGDESDE